MNMLKYVVDRIMVTVSRSYRRYKSDKNLLELMFIVNRELTANFYWGYWIKGFRKANQECLKNKNKRR